MNVTDIGVPPLKDADTSGDTYEIFEPFFNYFIGVYLILIGKRLP